MKHQASLRAFALIACGCLVSADALEAAASILTMPSAIMAQSTSQHGATTSTKANSTQPQTRKSRAKKPAPSSAKNTVTKSTFRRTTATKSAVSKSTVSNSAAKRAVARKASAKRYAQRPSSAIASKTSVNKTLSTKTTSHYTTSSKKKYSSRYRSSAKPSPKKYARATGKRHSRKYYSSRYHSKKSSSRYAVAPTRTVSEKVLKAQASFAETWHETLQDEELMPGVRYKHYIISTGSKHSIHVLEVDRTKPEVGVSLWKAQNLANGLESLPTIANRADSGKTGALQGMVNANFWRSYYNTPLGPAVVNGEVLEMGQYKAWSSCFFDRQNRMYIDRFSISATLRTRETSFPVETVNARLNPNGVVLYNHFAGKEVPIAPTLPVGNVEQGTASTSKTNVNKTKTSDNGFPIDEKLTQSQLQKTLETQRRIYTAERPLYKATLLYASQPMINEEVVCRVVEIDTGAVAVPQNGVVVSFGRNIDESELPRPGDKVTLMFKTNAYSSVPFVHAVSGTPRLVRSGIARHEAAEESTTGRNFITQKLPRTAIGTNSSGTMLYLVTTDPTDTEAGTTGMTLQELAEGMKQIGAYHAVNLDGGASASMIVRGSVNSSIGGTRPVSMALGIVQQDPSAERLQPKRKLITKPIGKQPSKSEQRPGGTPRQDNSNLSETEQSLLMQEHKPEERK